MTRVMSEVQRPVRRGVKILGLGFLSVAMFGAVQASIWLGSDERARAWGPIGESAIFTGLGLLCFVRRASLQNAIIAVCGGVTLVAVGIDAAETGSPGIAIVVGLCLVGGVVVLILLRRRKSIAVPPVLSPVAAERYVTVRALWCSFDPLGGRKDGKPIPADGYDAYAEESVQLLASGAATPEVVEHVRRVCEDSLGLDPKPPAEYEEFAAQLQSVASGEGLGD